MLLLIFWDLGQRYSMLPCGNENPSILSCCANYPVLLSDDPILLIPCSVAVTNAPRDNAEMMLNGLRLEKTFEVRVPIQSQGIPNATFNCSLWFALRCLATNELTTGHIENCRQSY